MIFEQQNQKQIPEFRKKIRFKILEIFLFNFK